MTSYTFTEEHAYSKGLIFDEYESDFADGNWFDQMAALLAILPVPFAVVVTATELMLPELEAWQEVCARNPVFLRPQREAQRGGARAIQARKSERAEHASDNDAYGPLDTPS